MKDHQHQEDLTKTIALRCKLNQQNQCVRDLGIQVGCFSRGDRQPQNVVKSYISVGLGDKPCTNVN